MAATLAELNPSLAWLSELAKMNLLKNDAALASWVERNFASPDAVREVVANLRFFTNESATIIEYRLNSQRDQLPSLYVKCWQLIIRHIRNTKQGLTQNEWFEVSPRLKRGDYSAETLDRLVQAATPKLYVEKRYGWYDKEPKREIKEPSDLLTIKYGIEDGISESDFFAMWPNTVPAITENRFVEMLTHALEGVLSDAQDVGVESNDGLSVSDIDVPSVAAHEQNAYRHGFQIIVRLIAELWSRLATKNRRLALSAFGKWEKSSFRLIHRLALFAAADASVPAKAAAGVLLHVPQGELFLSNSNVEVHRLIRKRWPEFPSKQRGEIERRIVVGPPTSWFREGAEITSTVDRKRFELLIDLENSGVALGQEAQGLMREIRQRHPKWLVTEPEKAGFVMWTGGVRGVVGNKDKLAAIPSKRLIRAAKRAADEADFMEGDLWQALCQSEPLKAFQGIANAAAKDRWQQWAWRPLFWNANKIIDLDALNRIAELFVQWPKTLAFDEVLPGASFWLDNVSDKLKASILWAAWDLIERRAPRRVEIMNNDPYGTSINDAAGHLTTVLLKKTPKPKRGVELGKQLRARYTKLLCEEGVFGLLVRVRLSAAVAFLYERAPKWTTKQVLPHFFWKSSDAAAMWSARKYGNYIGSEKLFVLTKEPYLALFDRSDVSTEDLRYYADWLGVILLRNQADTRCSHARRSAIHFKTCWTRDTILFRT